MRLSDLLAVRTYPTAPHHSQVSSIRAADVKGIHRMDIIGEFEAIEITHTANDR